jgi:hypothetical protein
LLIGHLRRHQYIRLLYQSRTSPLVIYYLFAACRFMQPTDSKHLPQLMRNAAGEFKPLPSRLTRKKSKPSSKTRRRLKEAEPYRLNIAVA